MKRCLKCVYGCNDFQLLFYALQFQNVLPSVDAIISSFALAVSLLLHMVWSWFWWRRLHFSLRFMVSMISSFYGCNNFFFCVSGVLGSVYGFNGFFLFSVRSMVSMASSVQACNSFFLCLSGVVTIRHGVVVTLMGKSSFLCAL